LIQEQEFNLSKAVTACRSRTEITKAKADAEVKPRKTVALQKRSLMAARRAGSKPQRTGERDRWEKNVLNLKKPTPDGATGAGRGIARGLNTAAVVAGRKAAYGVAGHEAGATQY
jgi:hypothetical protein